MQRESERAMDAARWERLQSLFHEAADLPRDERHDFLAARCAGDRTLVDDVLRLLEEDDRGQSVLDGDLSLLAARLLESTSPAARVPQSFGPYRLTKLLGEGGMGMVYLAERGDLGSVAAVKILRDAWLSPERRERFASEQRTLAQLNHPSIARLYDADALPDGTPWFVMEYVDGVSLTQYCGTHALPVSRRLRLFRSVCEAVQHAHRHAVIHRDIKPGNILVSPDGAVKLLDFGIAKQIESLDVATDRTRTGMRMMTPAYAAPEQIRGDRIGVHTDVYSLGVTLYELLTGKLPFDLANRTPAGIEAMILEHEPVKPSAVARKIAEQSDEPSIYSSASSASWAELDVLCLTAMHKDPQRRYATVDALIRDIDHFLRREPLEARPESWHYRLEKFISRHRRTVAVGSTMLLLLVGLVAFYTVRLAAARNAALREAERTARIQSFTLGLFNGGDDGTAPAESLRVLTLLERGVRMARTLDADPVAQADLYQTLGGIFLQLGEPTRADTLASAALETRRSAGGADDVSMARALVLLGAVREAQARYEDAERLVREGLGLARTSASQGSDDVAAATIALGQVLEDQGRYADAIPLFTEAIELRKKADAPERDVAEAMTALANTYFYSGEYAISDSLNRLVLAIDRKVYGDHHAAVANDLINLGAIQFQWGRYDEAERYYRQALRINESWYGAANPATASNLTMLGRALNFEGRYAEAVEVLDSALAIQERVYGPVHPRVASVLNDLGSIALAREQFDAAEADFARMRDIYSEVYGDRHYLLGVATSNLGSVYLARKDYARAEQLFREGARIYAESQGPRHLNTGIARIKLGRALLRQKRFADAAKESGAGYRIVSGQTSPSVSWLQAARKDLIEAFTALGEPDSAAHYRAEDEAAIAKPESSGVRLK